jgi:hypothetical protein
MRFEVLAATNKKMAVFWVLPPRSLVCSDDVSEDQTAFIIRVMWRQYVL